MTNAIKFQKVHYTDRLYSQFLLDHLTNMAAICKCVSVKDYAIATFLDYKNDSEEYGWTDETIFNTTKVSTWIRKIQLSYKKEIL
jgi:hypothetical protein